MGGAAHRRVARQRCVRRTGLTCRYRDGYAEGQRGDRARACTEGWRGVHMGERYRCGCGSGRACGDEKRGACAGGGGTERAWQRMGGAVWTRSETGVRGGREGRDGLSSTREGGAAAVWTWGSGGADGGRADARGGMTGLGVAGRARSRWRWPAQGREMR
jgi:hypothetical protein